MASELGACVLVVDDQEANLRMVAALLTRWGYRAVTALGGEEGLRQASEHKPDVLLLDMKMPGMDGFAVMRALREEVGSRDLPVIFLTADNERENLVRAFEAGAVDYVTKPFVAEELLARVRTHVDLKKSRDALRRFAQEKQQMAELVAHDLRNYFANIIFAADMVGGADGLSHAHRRMADSIRSSADSGMLFLQAFLEQQEHVAHGAEIEPLPVRQLLCDAVDLLARNAAAKEIQLELLARVRTHLDLKRSRDSLRRFAQEKQAMAELVAHDLRNYFANIVFAADLLGSSGEIQENQRKLAESIRSSADTGMLFLQAFLEQQEQQAHGAAIEPLPVRQMLCEVVDLLSRNAQVKGIRLELQPHETGIVSGLRAGVTHVLQNLVSNAV